MTVLLCGSLQTHPGTPMPSGGGHIIKAVQWDCQVDGGGTLARMLNLDDLSCRKGHGYPRTVIGYAVWAYHHFALSLRDVEDLLAERGITVMKRSGSG